VIERYAPHQIHKLGYALFPTLVRVDFLLSDCTR
jgi:hypothetical protein